MAWLPACIDDPPARPLPKARPVIDVLLDWEAEGRQYGLGSGPRLEARSSGEAAAGAVGSTGKIRRRAELRTTAWETGRCGPVIG